MRYLLTLCLLAAVGFAQNVTFKGSPVELKGEVPAVGTKAPVFVATKNDLSEVTIGGAKKTVQIIAFVPSIDTPVCSLETKTFDDKVKTLKGVELFVVSKDLPFAQKRFCGFEKIGNITVASAYKNKSDKGTEAYGVNIKSAPLTDLLTRAVFVVNTKGEIVYEQIVSEITKQPDYGKVLEAAQKAR
jgi:thioredoxin-dependent peroxiredoxin